MNFKAGANQTIIKEKVIVSETEAEIRRPGAMNMVVDYENVRMLVSEKVPLNKEIQYWF